MCGIVGYSGTREATAFLLAGLKEPEYRGHDAAGIASPGTHGLRCFKAVGKLANLVAKAGDYRSHGAVAAIGQTRWATHGKPSEENAHPRGLRHSRVVHDGIIENQPRVLADILGGRLSDDAVTLEELTGDLGNDADMPRNLAKSVTVEQGSHDMTSQPPAEQPDRA